MVIAQGLTLFLVAQTLLIASGQNAGALLERSNKDLRQGNFKRAVGDFSKVLEIDPNRAEAYYGRACGRMKIGALAGSMGWGQTKGPERRQAIADLSRAIELRHDYVEAYVTRALAAVEEFLASAAALRPLEKYQRYWNATEWAQPSEDPPGGLATAMADLDTALRMGPTADRGYAVRAYLRAMEGYGDEAIRDYEKATSLDGRWAQPLNPMVARAYYRRAMAKLGAGGFRGAMADLTGAIADLTTALGLDPSLAQAYQARGQVKRAQGDEAGARIDFATAAALGPPPPPPPPVRKR